MRNVLRAFPRRVILSIAALVFTQALIPNAQSQSWPSFRGGPANGISLQSKIPTRWSDTEHVAWKTPIHGRAWSSPVVEGNEIWLTTATEDGLKMFRRLCGFELWQSPSRSTDLRKHRGPTDFHATNTYGSPTPVIEGAFVYVHFGAYGTACLRRSDCSKFGSAVTCPAITIAEREARQSLSRVAHFPHGWLRPPVCRGLGLQDWRDRLESRSQSGIRNRQWRLLQSLLNSACNFCCWSGSINQPRSDGVLIAQSKNRRRDLASALPEHSTTVRPVFDGSRLYFSTGFSKAQMLCVKVDGSGDVTKTHIVWAQNKGIGSKPSPVLVQGRLFDITDDGVMCRLDLANGEPVWKQRLGGKFSASLVATSDYIVAVDHDGKGYVFSVEDEPKLVGENQTARRLQCFASHRREQLAAANNHNTLQACSLAYRPSIYLTVNNI